ncbi:MAG: VWA domain-containing protein [Rubrivivax sp.]|nr:VWA domain-containing protein [Pyrinomonadaceae bacterium]
MASVARIAASQSSVGGDAGFVSVALPTGGEVSVENRRGGVRVEVWAEDYVAVAALTQAPKRAARHKLPVAIERGESSLTIRVERATGAKPPRVDLKLRVPASARLKVFTSDGELEISGAPASLTAQTLSGDLRLSMPAPHDANVTAQSLNGTVTLGDGVEAAGAGGRVVRGKFQARLGAGTRAVNLFSGRGRINLMTLTEVADASATERPVARKPRADDAPDSGPGVAPGPARTPRLSEKPEEVDEDEVVRVESDLVTLNFSVVDRASGRGLAGLASNDFKIYEDNVEQRVEHFETADAAFDLLLLLDLSGSTARVSDTIRAAARRFVAATRPQDRIAIIAFAGETQIVAPPTSDRASLRESIDRIAPPKGDTRLYDSLASALDYVGRRADASRRRAVILMSDGLDSTLPNVTGTGSTASYDDVRSRVQEFDGIVYTIWVNTEHEEAFSPDDIQPETFDLAHDHMEEFASAGGGAFYEVEKLEDLAGAYERVVADLGTVYSISYRPTNKQRDGRWRAIRVRLPRLTDAVARGKRGYFAK